MPINENLKAVLEDFTTNDTFHGTTGDSQVPFMNDTRTTKYWENNAMEILSLPFYNEGGENSPDYAMAIILPKNNQSIQELCGQLTSSNFSRLITNLENKRVKISLPKFQYSYTTILNDTLKSLGMLQAFEGDKAQFGKIIEPPMSISVSLVQHDTYIRVDVTGAEAAAVTTIGMATAANPDAVDKIFKVGRPFLYTIYDQKDGTILFTGVTANITKPK